MSTQDTQATPRERANGSSETDQTETPSSWGGAVTIHHLDRDAFESDGEYAIEKSDIRIGRREISLDDVDELYRPVETVVGTTDLDEAYHRAQGWVVNQEQGGRHGVPSAHPSNVFERVHPNGDREYHLVEPIGFTEIEIGVDAVKTGGEL